MGAPSPFGSVRVLPEFASPVLDGGRLPLTAFRSMLASFIAAYHAFKRTFLHMHLLHLPQMCDDLK